MADEAAKQDANSVPTMLGITSGGDTKQVQVDNTGKIVAVVTA